jgi:hypothetical protein
LIAVVIDAVLANELDITIVPWRTYVVARVIDLHVVGCGRIALLKLKDHYYPVQILEGIGAAALDRRQRCEGTSELDIWLILNVQSRQSPKGIVILHEGTCICVKGRGAIGTREGVVVELGSRKGPLFSFLDVVADECEESTSKDDVSGH